MQSHRRLKRFNPFCNNGLLRFAKVAELADAPDLGWDLTTFATPRTEAHHTEKRQYSRRLNASGRLQPRARFRTEKQIQLTPELTPDLSRTNPVRKHLLRNGTEVEPVR
jgi:hypothetical protein